HRAHLEAQRAEFPGTAITSGRRRRPGRNATSRTEGRAALEEAVAKETTGASPASEVAWASPRMEKARLSVRFLFTGGTPVPLQPATRTNPRHVTIRHFLSQGSRVSLASMADSVTLNHAARIIATVAPDVPADAALRRYLYKAKRLGGPQK